MRVWRQPLRGLFTTDFARSGFAKPAESALLCVLSDSANSVLPRLTVQLPARSLARTSPRRVCSYYTHPGPAKIPSHFRFKRWLSPLQKYFLVCRKVARRVPAAFLPCSLPFHHYRLRPLVAAVPRPLLNLFSTAGSENNGPVVLEVLTNSLLHCF